MRNASPLLLIFWIQLLQQFCSTTHGGAIGERCAQNSDCRNPELVQCKDSVCTCKFGQAPLAPTQCKEATAVTQKPDPETRECYTDHQCYRGYCWDGTCHCKDGFSKERNSYGGWSCVHRTSSFGFGILAVIPVTVVVICLVACCVQVALRKQQQVPASNAAAAVQPQQQQQDDLSRVNSNATISGVSNIYRQRRYFPHYVESSTKPHGTQQGMASSPCVSRPIEMKPVEAKETVPDYDNTGDPNSSVKA